MQASGGLSVVVVKNNAEQVASVDAAIPCFS